MTREQVLWAVRIRYGKDSKDREPFLAGKYWRGVGELGPALEREVNTRLFMTRADARRCIPSKRGYWGYTATPVRVRVTVEEIEP